MTLKILAVDQARHGAWALFDYERKELLKYDVWNFEWNKVEFEKAVAKIKKLIEDVINTYDVDAIFIEDIHLRRNPKSFKMLAHLQGVLINLFEENEFVYGVISPSTWQTYCHARGRTEKEKKEGVTTLSNLENSTVNTKDNIKDESDKTKKKKQSKELSLEVVKELYNIQTENDNLADAILIGHYVVNNISVKMR